MTTLAEIRRVNEGPVATYVDATTPDGHFVAEVKTLGVHISYLLEGAEGALTATVKGRIEAKGMGAAVRVYVGGGVRGGKWNTRFESTEQAFAAMV